jgi:uncharacterized protein YecT (DUF1311 family)
MTISGLTSVSYSQSGYVPGQPSIDCTNVHNTVALILCSVPEAAEADWDLNSASWALYFTVNDAGRRMLDLDQQAWRQSLDRICALPRQLTEEEQAGQAMGQAFGRMILGPGVRIPGFAARHSGARKLRSQCLPCLQLYE